VNDPTMWILARATGLVAYGLLAAAMLLGLALAGRARPPGLRPADVTEAHRTLSLLALVLTAVHGVALVLDRAVHIPLAALIVPGLSDYRAEWVAAGVIALWTALAVHVSFALRGVIGARVWRRLHMGAYAAFACATVHGLLAGTSSGSPAGIALYGGAVGLVAGATAWRAGVERRRRSPRPAPGAGGAA